MDNSSAAAPLSASSETTLEQATAQGTEDGHIPDSDGYFSSYESFEVRDHSGDYPVLSYSYPHSREAGYLLKGTGPP